MACQRWVTQQLSGPAGLTLQSSALPEPRKGEVRVKVSATTATYTDLLVLSGSYIPKVRSSRAGAARRARRARRRSTQPAVVGLAANFV